MSEHLPECPILKPCCDDEQFPEHGFCGNYVGRCLHCMAECICDALRACEARVKDEALAQAWALATNACIDAFYNRISDSDLDDILTDDEKDTIAHAIRGARQKDN